VITLILEFPEARGLQTDFMEPRKCSEYLDRSCWKWSGEEFRCRFI